MFLDARTLTEGTRIEADICIIGAGAAGITLARDLADGKRRIALIESGGLEFDEETQELYEGQNTGQAFTPLVADRLRYLGGTTNHWSGSCHPFDPIDFEQRPYIRSSGWPFERAALEPYYRRAQEICQLGPFSYDPKDWAEDGAAPLDLGAEARLTTSIYQYSPPTRFGEVYRQDLTNAPDLTVYLNTNVAAIETDPGAKAVTGLRLACLHGPKLHARAKLYVLAAGGIENPRLLLNANAVQKAGLGNAADLVGRYFMDHPFIPNAATVLLNQKPSALALYAGVEREGHKAAGYLYPIPAVQRREQLPAFSMGLQAGSLPDKDFAKLSAIAIWHAVRAGHWPRDLGFHIARIWRGVEWEAGSVYDRLAHAEPAAYSVNYMCECPPDPASRVTLIDDVDALGLRRVALDWRLPDDFAKTTRRAHELLAEDLGRTGLGRLRLNFADAELRDAVQNAHHHMGTTRMHRDPKQGVVDENCRIHDMANLYVAGSSVFPTYSFDDPTMTIVTLALRLSDHLKASFE
jgi:choline dehydrogenase-like flavoprotein